MSTKHTPGPWTQLAGQDTIWARDGELLVARTDYTRGAMAVNEDEANAHLIAAAPELLDFAKQFIDFVAWGDSAKPATVRVAELLQFARAAIAKAEDAR